MNSLGQLIKFCRDDHPCIECPPVGLCHRACEGSRVWDCPTARPRPRRPRMWRMQWTAAECAGSSRSNLVPLRAYRALRQFPACLFGMWRSPAAAGKGCAASQMRLRESAPRLPGMRRWLASRTHWPAQHISGLRALPNLPRQSLTAPRAERAQFRWQAPTVKKRTGEAPAIYRFRLSATDHTTDPMVSSAPMTGSISDAWT